jgi:hypothetical protein
MISLLEYFGPWDGHADDTPARRANAERLLGRVNPMLSAAASDGVDLELNPGTNSLVSGHGLGGFRPQACGVGAPRSRHKEGSALDVYDPHRALAGWCIEHPEALLAANLYMEDPRWTPTWVHLQTEPPLSGKRVYIPSSSPPLATRLAGQQGLA